ncbi:gliding motility-associated C-terminal domain-containing protein [Mucilaginibacter roseus]|uniref:Gliding motility-associated C-terminal domain-containing protein n=1 Tax=Mucilaginibacter roseus TaxID=1528868 RepID=A0ABS8U4E4_9SPHI|nr:gliding motility-associated C-terminal domain-containing protein [Mucilaginibacter roseus]MCD8740679.1 gliding motility-associated C-terminal domain-containing protein [Mucilaginibacter roseus]
MIPELHKSNLIRFFLLMLFCFITLLAHAQQDVEFHLAKRFLEDQNIIKIKRNYGDAFLWILTDNNKVYRINEDHNSAEDFTEKFNLYKAEKFIDIVGIAKDTVFLATPSKVLELKGTDLSVIFEQKDIGQINSLGRRYDNNGINENKVYNGRVIIATDKYTVYYNYLDGTYSGAEGLPYTGQIYESTRRALMCRAIISTSYFNIPYIPASITSYDFSQIHLGYLWTDNYFGDTVKTASYMVQLGYDGLYASNQFWATPNGLFQTSWKFFTADPYINNNKYLSGVNINKVTNIYGFANFRQAQTSEGLVRSNLLVGADDGLYFSNSKYSELYLRPKFTFYECPELKNIKVNDICVNDASNAEINFCEDGVWVATTKGIYLLKPDWGKFLNSQQLNAIRFENQAADVTSITLCGQTQKVIIEGYTGLQYEWYKNGVKLAGQTGNELDVKSPGDFYVELYDPCSGVHIKSNTLKAIQGIAPVLTFNYPDQINICNKQPYRLSINNNAAYKYRWYKDNELTDKTTSSISVTETGKYKVEVSSCPDSWVASKEVQVNFIGLPVATLAADKAIYCQGELARLTINIPLNPKYNIYWLRDGVVVNELTNEKEARTNIAGTYTVNVKSTADAACGQSSQPLQLQFTSAPTFSFNYPDVVRTCAGRAFELKADGNAVYNYRWFKNNIQLNITTNTLPITESGSYRVEASACSGSWVPSKTVQVNVITVPVIRLSANKAAYCDGDNATLFINTSASNDYLIRWWRDGDPLVEATDKISIVTNKAGNYNVTIEGRGVTTCTQVSNMLALAFSPQPTLSIQQVASATLCEGSTVELRALHPANTNGVVTWSSGQTGDVLRVNRSGTYTAELRTPAGCTVSESINVNLLPNPILSIANAELCPYDNESVTLNAPTGYVKYIWNGQPGGASYTANRIGNVSLTVTDFNGCTATQIIKVSNKCDDIKIPNTFTPNGDGINDNWNISGIQGNNAIVVKVYNRNGALVFESAGYPIPWNGTSRGQQLPVGSYYYIISVKNSTQVLSGSVAILR